MSAKLPTKEEELCYLENRLKNKKWIYIGCIQKMFYEDGIGEFIDYLQGTAPLIA